MRIGVSISSTHEIDAPPKMIERARVAHESGFASMTIGDHHNMAVPYAQNTPMLGRLLAEWPDRPAGCLFLVPLWHPVLMAEQIGTLAAIHSDRFIVQTAIGYGESQFAAFGTTERTRGRVIDEAVPLVRRLLDGETVDSNFFRIAGGRIGLRSDRPIEWWIAGGSQVALERAARLGDAWYAQPSVDVATGRRLLEAYRDAGGQSGILRKDALVLNDGDQARSVANELITAGYRGLSTDQLIIGSPDDAAEQLAAYASVGFDEVVIRTMSVPQELALETLALTGAMNGSIS